MEPIGVIVIFVVAGMFGLAIWGFTQNANNKEKKEGVKNNITKDGFKPDSLLIKIPLGSNKLIGIAIDRTSNKICLIDEDTKRYIDSIDIIESEVLIDGKTVTKTSRASQFAGAAVGAVLLGGVGAMAEEIKKLKELKETGALSEDEFQQAKEKLISSWS